MPARAARRPPEAERGRKRRDLSRRSRADVQEPRALRRDRLARELPRRACEQALERGCVQVGPGLREQRRRAGDDRRRGARAADARVAGRAVLGLAGIGGQEADAGRDEVRLHEPVEREPAGRERRDTALRGARLGARSTDRHQHCPSRGELVGELLAERRRQPDDRDGDAVVEADPAARKRVAVEHDGRGARLRGLRRCIARVVARRDESSAPRDEAHPALREELVQARRRALRQLGGPEARNAQRTASDPSSARRLRRAARGGRRGRRARRAPRRARTQRSPGDRPRRR